MMFHPSCTLNRDVFDYCRKMFGSNSNSGRNNLLIFYTLPEANSSHLEMDGWNTMYSHQPVHHHALKPSKQLSNNKQVFFLTNVDFFPCPTWEVINI